PRPHHVTEARARLVERLLDVAEALDGLCVRIALADDRAVVAGRGRAGDADVPPDPNGAGVPDDRLVGAVAFDVLPFHAWRSRIPRSLSPRPLRFKITVAPASACFSRTSQATACDDSSAGRMPSVSASRWKAARASSSRAES